MPKRGELTMVALSFETRNKLAKFRDEQDVKSYDEAINLLFDLVASLFKDLETVSPRVNGEKT